MNWSRYPVGYAVQFASADRTAGQQLREMKKRSDPGPERFSFGFLFPISQEHFC